MAYWYPNVALIFNGYSNFLVLFQEAHIKRVCAQVFSSFPDFVQLSKDAAFETISDPKYSGKMKVNLFFRRKISISNSNRSVAVVNGCKKMYI